jgi:phosphatidylglycerol:prolipoprotein diacylglycerol transferase
MRPELFRVFDISAPSYFVLLVTGFLFATALGAIWARRIGQDPDSIVDLGLFCIIMGVVGGRILHVFADGYFMDYVHLCTDPSLVKWPYEQSTCLSHQGIWDEVANVCRPGLAPTWAAKYVSPGLEHVLERTWQCTSWAHFWAGGLTYYGGFIGASIGAVYLLRRDRFPFWKAADMAGFAVPLGLCFGRMGCLLAGCCFGRESASSLALSFPPHSPASDAQYKVQALASAGDWSHPVLPTQIFESAMCLAIAAFCLFYVHGKKRYDGQVFLTFVALYAGGRFLLEFLRADDRGGLLGISTSQLIGLGAIALVVAAHTRLKKRTDDLLAAPASAAVS